jgi:hypothetical protein
MDASRGRGRAGKWGMESGKRNGLNARCQAGKVSDYNKRHVTFSLLSRALSLHNCRSKGCYYAIDQFLLKTVT